MNDLLTFATANGSVAPVYIYIVDSKQVLSKDFGLSNLTPTLFSTTFHTSANLTVGQHTGTLQVQICKDVQCAAQYAGSPVDLPYEIVVNNYSLTSRMETSPQATMHLGGAAPDASVFVNAEGQEWSARSEASWLKVSTEKRRGSGVMSVSFVSAGLAPGNYSANIIVSNTTGQTNVLPFNLTILPKQVDFPTPTPTPVPSTPTASGPSSVTPPIEPPAEIRITSAIPQFTAVNGEPIAGQAVSFVLTYRPFAQWSASTTASWLPGSPLSGTTQGSVMLRPDPSIAKLASGTYSTDLLLTSSGGLSRKVSVGLTLLPASLTVSESSILLGGDNGRDYSVKTLNIRLNTGSNAFPWVLSDLPDWVTTTTPSGTVSQKGATLSFGLDLNKLPYGSSSAAAMITVTVNGDKISVPITINANRDQQKLLASEWGIGLSSTPTGDVTSRSIKISDNFAGNTAWTATSDSAWLSVTPSGTTGKTTDLVMKAIQASLQMDR
ncbi:hypothetical protein HA050_17305 [Iodobacter sp. HSC-16F04]|uniref:BACON domain-containing protein n=1 Tax=Iodobacter violaceini TaxID=3044271 RepID=A0ABX0L0W7_9NEIS|nr:hypothetical protein [Iodobacter violacea]NHQ87869.1 hypothetical protein [Iodobacter violacea]